GKRKWSENKDLWNGIWRKTGKQTLKDYVLFPALTGPLFVSTLLGNAAANLVRNIWAYSIIFCGHFPSGVATFSEEETENETRGQWYLRQMMGSANITGGKLFHIMSGNLSHQIEHHLFPDIPARRRRTSAASPRSSRVPCGTWRRRSVPGRRTRSRCVMRLDALRRTTSTSCDRHMTKARAV